MGETGAAAALVRDLGSWQWLQGLDGEKVKQSLVREFLQGSRGTPRFGVGGSKEGCLDGAAMPASSTRMGESIPAGSGRAQKALFMEHASCAHSLAVVSSWKSHPVPRLQVKSLSNFLKQADLGLKHGSVKTLVQVSWTSIPPTLLFIRILTVHQNCPERVRGWEEPIQMQISKSQPQKTGLNRFVVWPLSPGDSDAKCSWTKKDYTTLLLRGTTEERQPERGAAKWGMGPGEEKWLAGASSYQLVWKKNQMQLVLLREIKMEPTEKAILDVIWPLTTYCLNEGIQNVCPMAQKLKSLLDPCPK